MIKLATAQNMQHIDNRTINEKGVPGLLLMERAAIAVAEEIMKECPVTDHGLVVAEGGNNGGDALAAARMLINAGYDIEVRQIGAISHETESFRQNKHILNQMGVKLIISDVPDFDGQEYDFVIEGIFGLGLKRDIAAPHDAYVRALNEMRARRYSIDVPAGINADTGKVMGAAYKADKTITFGFNKPGLLLYPGASYAGETVVRDIGFDRQVVCEEQMKYYACEMSDLKCLPVRRPDAHKGSCGRLAVIAGSEQMAGAAILSARAAYVMGTGMVKVYTHEKNRNVICSGLPESLIMIYATKEEAAMCAKDAVSFADTILVGPGLSMDDMARAIIDTLLRLKPGRVVADADALNIMADAGIAPRDIGESVIITPHLKEMSRLCGRSVAEISDDMPGTALDYAEGNDIICVLKSARTCIAAGDLYINTSGNDGMAVAGSGDVLAGIIAGLLATGAAASDAAVLGAYIHGLAGDMAAKALGKRSMLSGDIIAHIPDILEAQV